MKSHSFAKNFFKKVIPTFLVLNLCVSLSFADMQPGVRPAIDYTTRTLKHAEKVSVRAVLNDLKPGDLVLSVEVNAVSNVKKSYIEFWMDKKLLTQLTFEKVGMTKNFKIPINLRNDIGYKSLQLRSIGGTTITQIQANIHDPNWFPSEPDLPLPPPPPIDVEPPMPPVVIVHPPEPPPVVIVTPPPPPPLVLKGEMVTVRENGEVTGWACLGNHMQNTRVEVELIVNGYRVDRQLADENTQSWDADMGNPVGQYCDRFTGFKFRIDPMSTEYQGKQVEIKVQAINPTNFDRLTLVGSRSVDFPLYFIDQGIFRVGSEVFYSSGNPSNEYCKVNPAYASDQIEFAKRTGYYGEGRYVTTTPRSMKRTNEFCPLIKAPTGLFGVHGSKMIYFSDGNKFYCQLWLEPQINGRPILWLKTMPPHVRVAQGNSYKTEAELDAMMGTTDVKLFEFCDRNYPYLSTTNLGF